MFQSDKDFKEKSDKIIVCHEDHIVGELSGAVERAAKILNIDL